MLIELIAVTRLQVLLAFKCAFSTEFCRCLSVSNPNNLCVLIRTTLITHTSSILIWFRRGTGISLPSWHCRGLQPSLFDKFCGFWSFPHYSFLPVPTLPLVRCSSIVRAKFLIGVSMMPTPTTSIDHMIYTLSEIAFYYHYYPAQRPSSSTGGRSKGGKTLSGKTRIRGTDRLVMVEKMGCYVMSLNWSNSPE